MVAAQKQFAPVQQLAVSIPVRVLGWLQQQETNAASSHRRSFNPCKGFGVVAAICCPIAISKRHVSIPVRVLGWLQLLTFRQVWEIAEISRFNPCKGFGVVAAQLFSWQFRSACCYVSIPVRVLGWLQRENGATGGSS